MNSFITVSKQKRLKEKNSVEAFELFRIQISF